jgi:hypothetical protein
MADDMTVKTSHHLTLLRMLCICKIEVFCCRKHQKVLLLLLLLQLLQSVCAWVRTCTQSCT